MHNYQASGTAGLVVRFMHLALLLYTYFMPCITATHNMQNLLMTRQPGRHPDLRWKSLHCRASAAAE